ncbi:MAG: hypothetical protein QOF37_1728 [Thermoleophilaceae bacterium]|nr:hypothetical protein [Thermoleophilaceae bacterium]
MKDRLRKVAGLMSLGDELDSVRAQMGRLQAAQLAGLEPGDVRAAEFTVFSQWGEDGIIQHLLRHVPIDDEVFVEFGVADYAESNTRFLLVNDNWRGLILDGGTDHQAFLHRTGLDWRHHIDAVSAFIDRDNIDGLIRAAGIEGDIGLLSIDLDGNDLWVLERISAVSPRILTVEYNATFGPEAAVTVPYDPAFQRTAAHSSNLYWGASVAALDMVARRRGYTLVAGNQAGNNLFFVRDDVAGDLVRLSPAEAWSPSRFRESRGPGGELTYVADREERLRIIRDMPLWDLEADAQTTVAERFGV